MDSKDLKKSDSPKSEVVEEKVEMAKKMPMKKKAAVTKMPARPLKEAKVVKKKEPSASPRRTAAAAPVARAPVRAPARMAPARMAPPARNAFVPKENEYNKKFIEQIKGASIDLRATGADVETDPTLELGLLLDCTSSMSSWIARAK